MKRTLICLLAILMMLSMVACAVPSDTELKEPVSVVTGNGTGETQADAQEETATPKEVSVEETVLVDESGVKVTAKSLESSLFGTELKLLIENNSGKNLTFQCRNASVNGYMVETMMSVDVANGKKANDSLTFVNTDLELCGIETIADMEMSFHIFTTEGWDDYLDTDAIQLKTSAADGFVYNYDDSGEVAYEGNGVKVVVKGLSEDASLLGTSVIVYIENTSNENVTVQAREASVNGFMIDPIFSCDVVAGKHAMDTITFMSSDLEENSITAVEEIELSFHIFGTDDWDTIVDTEPVKISY